MNSGEVLRCDDANIITQQQLKSRVDTDDVIVVDVRNPDEVERSGKIKAKRWINIPLDRLEVALGLCEEEFQSKYGISKIAPDGSDVVFHCGKGGRGTKATLLAVKLGYSKCKHLEGGQSTWKRNFPDG